MSRVVFIGFRNGLLQQGLQNYLLSQSFQCVSISQFANGLRIDLNIVDEFQSNTKKLAEKTPTILCKDFNNRSDVLSALHQGVKACLSIWSSYRHLDLAIDSLSTGRSYLCPVASELMCQSMGLTHTDLTPRELDVMESISVGYSSKQIARKLGVSPSTVETHRRNIMQKIGAHKAAEVTRYAMNRRPVLEDSALEKG